MARKVGVVELRVRSKWYKLIASLEEDALVVSIDENNFDNHQQNHSSDVNSNVVHGRRGEFNQLFQSWSVTQLIRLLTVGVECSKLLLQVSTSPCLQAVMSLSRMKAALDPL